LGQKEKKRWDFPSEKKRTRRKGAPKKKEKKRGIRSLLHPGKEKRGKIFAARGETKDK